MIEKRFILIWALLFLLISSSSANQTEGPTPTKFAESAVLCVAVLSLTAQQTDDQEFTEMVTRDARWWNNLVATMFGPSEAERRTDARIGEVAEIYNSNEMDWDDMLDSARDCSQSKIELQHGTQQ